jgi:hypothetical protein
MLGEDGDARETKEHVEIAGKPLKKSFSVVLSDLDVFPG